MDTLKSINFFRIKKVNNQPSITLHGDFLFDTEFFPNEFLKAEIYAGKIVITKATY